MSQRMRAKFKISKIEKYEGSENLKMGAVGANTYGQNDENEDNDFARYTPFGELQMSITNPNLLGKFNEGETYYLDFTPCKE